MSFWQRINNGKTSTYLAAAFGMAFLAIILYSQFANNPTQYQTKLAQEREQKDLQFKNDPDGPLTKAQKKAFEGLTYFSINEAYVTPARWVPNPQPDTLLLMTTTGEDRQMVRAGKLQFQLQGTQQALTAYRYLDPALQDELFVPFRDLTSGLSTYGGGRYLDLQLTDPLVIDFNRAYNPYCVYNPSYSCPLPPPENKLNLEIRAGELMWVEEGEKKEMRNER